mgnify:CR=1 FL=1
MRVLVEDVTSVDSVPVVRMPNDATAGQELPSIDNCGFVPAIVGKPVFSPTNNVQCFYDFHSQPPIVKDYYLGGLVFNALIFYGCLKKRVQFTN